MSRSAPPEPDERGMPHDGAGERALHLVDELVSDLHFMWLSEAAAHWETRALLSEARGQTEKATFARTRAAHWRQKAELTGGRKIEGEVPHG
jgi:hypothetical protein